MTRRPPPRRFGRQAWPFAQRVQSAVWASALLVLAQPAAARCLNEDTLEAFNSAPVQSVAAPEPRLLLQSLVGEALQRSHAVGAAKLLAEAALNDIEETKAAHSIQASLSSGFGPGGSRVNGVTESAAAQLRANLNIGQLLYDGGRTDRLTDWKTQLAESARYGHLSQQEQLALTTVSLALERSRLRSQVQVWRQHVRKMGCLAEALETLVRADRGRASEYVQAKKTLEQAELSQTQTQSSLRQIEVRLRRLVGDGLPPTEGLSSMFTLVPGLEELVSDVEKSYDLAQLGAQETAAKRYAEAVAAQGKPQLSWAVTGNAAGSQGRQSDQGGSKPPSRSGAYSMGLTLNIPLLSPGIEPASQAARKRAQAASLQRAEALESRRFRVAEVHEQAQSALDRARRLAEVLRSSEQVRNFTLQQWQQLGKRSLFDVMGAETEHYNLRLSYVNALHDVQQLNANLLSLGRGVGEWLR